MKVKTSELNGNALDWAVAKCEGWDGLDIHDNGAIELERSDTGDCLWLKCFEPSTDWAKGGPIIEREGIRIVQITPTVWGAVYSSGDLGREHFATTPLIAAMRCYVASKFGDTVEIPDQFL